MIVDTLAQAYRWTLDDIRKLTYPQILMLNHASGINKKRMDARIESKRRSGTMTPGEMVADTPLIGGKRLDELTSEELFRHHGSEGPRPRVIKPKKE